MVSINLFSLFIVMARKTMTGMGKWFMVKWVLDGSPFYKKLSPIHHNYKQMNLLCFSSHTKNFEKNITVWDSCVFYCFNSCKTMKQNGIRHYLEIIRGCIFWLFNQSFFRTFFANDANQSELKKNFHPEPLIIWVLPKKSFLYQNLHRGPNLAQYLIWSKA